MKFWASMQEKLGIGTALTAVKSTNARLAAIEEHLVLMTVELSRMRKKVVRKPQTYGEIERQGAREAHPDRF